MVSGRSVWAGSPKASAAIAVGAIIALAVLAFLVLYVTRAAPTSLNQVAYLPIVYGAHRFGSRGSLGAGVLVMVLTGPVLGTLGVPNGGPEAG
jgi:hypothetical protein